MALYAVARQPCPRIDARLARNPTQDLCFAMASRWVRQLSLTLWDILTTVKFEFRVAAYLDGAQATYFNKRWGGVSVDDNGWFDGHVKAAWPDVWASKQMDFRRPSKVQVGEKRVNCYGYSGKGKVHADEVLAYMVLGKDADWLPDLFRITENVKKGKHRIFALSLNSAHLVDYMSEISK